MIKAQVWRQGTLVAVLLQWHDEPLRTKVEEMAPTGTWGDESTVRAQSHGLTMQSMLCRAPPVEVHRDVDTIVSAVKPQVVTPPVSAKELRRHPSSSTPGSRWRACRTARRTKAAHLDASRWTPSERMRLGLGGKRIGCWWWGLNDSTCADNRGGRV
jgi:hypothetical protein